MDSQNYKSGYIPECDDLLSVSMLSYHYMSALNLPIILEEDAESENGKNLNFNRQLSLGCEDEEEDDNSPFCVVIKNRKSHFENGQDNSKLMKNLWSKVSN